MQSFKIFNPEPLSPVPDNTDVMVVMGNILGGALEYLPGQEGDHAYRARWLANQLGVRALAYIRPQTVRSQIDAKNADLAHVITITRIARDLHDITTKEGAKTVALIGASAAATEGIELVRSQCIAPDALGIFDPIAMKQMTIRHGFQAWIRHQKSEGQRPPSARNHHPMAPLPQLSQSLSAAASLARTGRDMAANARQWSSNGGREALQTILSDDKLYGDIAIHGVFVERTMTQTANEAASITQTLQKQVSPARPAAARFVYAPGRYHSWPDDPQNFADFAAETLSLVRYAP